MSSADTIRVLHSLGSLNRGGIETWLMNLLRQRLSSLKMDFIVFAPGGTYEEEARALGATIYYYPQLSRLQKRVSVGGLLKYPREVVVAFKRKQYHVFHAHGTEFLGDAVRAAAEYEGIHARIAHCHTTGIGRFRGSPEMWVRGARFVTIDRHRILTYATDILAASEEAGQFLLSKQWGTDPRCRIAYCGIDLLPFELTAKKLSRIGVRRLYAIPDDAVVVGHVGSMWPDGVKNHPFLLDVFETLARRDKRYFLFMAGDGPQRPILEAMVRERGLEGRVITPGLCENVPALMVHCFDVHMLPSLYEGLPVVGLEATAGGLFTVCSDTITRDFTERLAARVRAISLQCKADVWAAEVEAGIANRISPAEGIELIRKSPFSIEASASSLLDIYRSRLQS